MPRELAERHLSSPKFARLVGKQIERAARDLLVPNFKRSKRLLDYREKLGGEPVTEIDLSMQARLVDAFCKLLPESEWLSEEMADPRAALNQRILSDVLWIIDPLDGTTAFLEGRPTFGVAVTLCLRGVPTVGWLYSPMDGRLAYGSAAFGGWWDGTRVAAKALGGESCYPRMRGVIASGDFPEAYRLRVESWTKAKFNIRGTASCVFDYLDLLSGNIDFLLYLRSLPWDHSAGCVLVNAAGGRVVTFGRNTFQLGNWNSGLLVVRDPALLPELSPLLPNAAELKILRCSDAH